MSRLRKEIAYHRERKMRTIIREEIQRDRTGPRCPECGSQQVNWSMLDIDRMADAEEEWTVLCGDCTYGGAPETFDPMEQSLNIGSDEIEDDEVNR